MSRNPGQIVEIIDVDLPRPRSLAMRESNAFIAYTKRIRTIFTQLGVLKEG
jgi:NitT/TauT family transport system ATP-binding protein